MTTGIDGKKTSDIIKSEIAEETAKLKLEAGVVPGLAVVIVGQDPASQVYVRNKCLACERVGFYSEKYEMAADTTENELIDLINKLNNDEKIHGILVQLPLPKHIDVERVLLTIKPEKDVDAFHPYNTGKIMLGKYDFLPCTPAGVMELLRRYNVDVSGKHCVVIGRSDIVGKPMAMLLLKENCTVTVCHSRTENLPAIVKTADIVVGAVGKPRFIQKEWLKEGVVLVDAGYNAGNVGDIDLDNAKEIASAYTPVPGGVGPMTINTLMLQTIDSASKIADRI